MKNLNLVKTFYSICSVDLSKQFAAIVIFAGIFSILFNSDSNSQDNAFAQTVLETCLPDRGINTAQSNCFSNTPSSPVYNATSTDTVRPPEENTPTYYNGTNTTVSSTSQ